MKSYLAITPARDEEEFLPGLIASMAAQTCVPARWIIIDDGSADDTRAIIDDAARTHPWIEPQHLSRNGPRAAGGESLIMRFLQRDMRERYDFVLRLDADLSFESHIIEQMLAEFAHDPSLGIAGATLYEPSGEKWVEVPSPAFHTRGAVKMYSSACFAAIGGLEAGLGWDTVDEAHAMMLGFKTRSFRHIHARHHRPQGAAGGLWRARMAAGVAAYRAGYSPAFMMARAARQVIARPFVLAALLMLAGYCRGYLHRVSRAASPELVRFVRRQQWRRLLMQESKWR